MRLSRSVVRRVLLPIMFAIALVVLIEAVVTYRYQPGLWQKTTWLMHDQFLGEPFDRVQLYVRLSNLEDSNPEIISVGDSSGFFSLQSTIVNRYTGGHKYLSLNTGANHAYSGYKAIAEYMLQRSSNLKFVVLYLFPQLLPQDAVFQKADLGKILHDDLVGLRSRLTPPSASISPYIKFWLFGGTKYNPNLPLANHVPSLQLWSTVDDALGWLPEFDIRFSRLGEKVNFYSDARPEWYHQLGLTDPSSTNAHLDDFYKMVRRYGAQLVIAFSPFPQTAVPYEDPNLLQAEKALVRFQNEHPDVKFLFPFLTTWGTEKFGLWNHISREYTFLSSERLGLGLNRLLTSPQSITPLQAQSLQPKLSQPIIATPSGASNPDLVKPALALFGYASTGDKSYEELLSTRVRNLLANEKGYQYMIADAQKRFASLASRNIEIGIDLSQLHATPVEISGLNHCNLNSNTKWVHIYGSMVFTYASSLYNTSEPVEWPETSGIYIPLVIENGEMKFDGYCPEVSMIAMQRDVIRP